MDNPLPQEARKELARRIVYVGHPHHKKQPGDFNLTPPAQPRPDKTLCDGAGIGTRVEAQRWLVEGAKRGLVSNCSGDEFPKNIWVVTDQGIVLEARGDEKGRYHGYPLFEPDPFREVVLKRWKES